MKMRLLIAPVVCSLASAAAAETYYVGDAYWLQWYIDNIVVDGDVICLLPETYLVEETIDTRGLAVTIRGWTDSTGAPMSILDGQGLARVLRCTSGETDATVFENLVIQNGYGEEIDITGIPMSHGGGMLSIDSSPRLINCVFKNNFAEAMGGGMLVTGMHGPGMTTLIDCVFERNSAGTGGGLHVYIDYTTIRNCSFIENDASYGGGGLFSSFCCTEISNCLFASNTASKGGAVFNTYGSGPFDDCLFAGNSAEYGGAIFNEGSPSGAQLTDCILAGNIADYGGGMYNENNYSQLEDCTFTECCQVVPPNSFIDNGGNDYDSWCDDCRANVDCVNGVDGADLTLLLGAWGSSEAQYDLNGDGVVDGADLTIVLAAWGPCLSR